MAISPEEFQLIRTFLQEHSGILINEGKEYLVENRLMVLLVQNGCEDFKALHKKLLADKGPLRSKVVDAMTTNETLWFRDTSFSNALENFIVPRLVEKAKKGANVRIWSAACSTGQEPYSVAMLLDSAMMKMGGVKRDCFRILATDISSSAILMAKSARYSQLAISRGMRPDFLSRYFSKKGMIYEVVPEVREMVTFQSFNLKNDFTVHGVMDFIMCRNVLIYFSEEMRVEIYEKMRSGLVRDGLLAIGASESPRGYTSAFRQVMMGNAALYQPA